MGGFGNLLLPVCLQAPDMVFPRANNVSLVSLHVGAPPLTSGATAEEGVGSGWTLCRLWPHMTRGQTNQPTPPQESRPSVDLGGVSLRV